MMKRELSDKYLSDLRSLLLPALYPFDGDGIKAYIDVDRKRRALVVSMTKGEREFSFTITEESIKSGRYKWHLSPSLKALWAALQDERL